MSLAADLRRFKAKAIGQVEAVMRETVLQFAGSLVTDWTPFGDPTLWKAPPPADYVPGNLQSSWFLSVGAPSRETTPATNVRAMNHLDRLPDRLAGQLIYLSNSAPHATAIEAGHSSQAPVGIMWASGEFGPMAEAFARRSAA